MVDPFNVTNYARTSRELEEFLLFCMAVAGKTAVVTARALDRFLKDIHKEHLESTKLCGGNSLPLSIICNMSRWELEKAIEKSRLGKIRLLTKGYHELAEHDAAYWRGATVGQLEKVHGIGPKTARFFLLHTRRDARVAVLDTHMLRHLRRRDPKCPRTTPQSSAAYTMLERRVLKMADRAGMTPAEFDLMIWKKYTRTKPLVKELAKA
jgi:thermostable 8-oxoguanine DNA glycosylase